MAVTFDFEIKSAFVLRRDSVSRVWRTLESIGAVSATAHCADNARRGFESLSQLLAFDNARAKQIRSLQFSARSEDGKRHANVAFRGRFASNPIAVTLSAPEDGEILQKSEELKDTIDGTRTWYSLISRVDMGAGFIACLVVLWFVLDIAVGDPPDPRVGVGLGRAVFLTVQLMGFFGVIGLFGWVLWRLHARYFPRAFFALGQGAERYKDDEKMRWVVIIGFAISVFGSFVVAFLTG